jgi:hypothetical protein
VAHRVPTLRRAASDLLLSVMSVGILVALLVAFDPQVRDEVSAMMDGRGSAQVAASTGQARRLFAIVSASVKEQSQEHRPLMVMFVAGAALALFMFRT